jgi:hypothetical protein
VHTDITLVASPSLSWLYSQNKLFIFGLIDLINVTYVRFKKPMEAAGDNITRCYHHRHHHNITIAIITTTTTNTTFTIRFLLGIARNSIKLALLIIAALFTLPKVRDEVSSTHSCMHTLARVTLASAVK